MIHWLGNWFLVPMLNWPGNMMLQKSYCAEVLAANDLECDELNTICHADADSKCDFIMDD